MISGGGTAGHIHPAISIAHALQKKYPQSYIHFVGAKNRMEMEKVPALGFSITSIDIAGFQRKKMYKNWGLPWKLLKSFYQVFQLLRKYKPKAVIGTGGYVSAPLVFIAALMGYPTIIQEQNAIPGYTNRILGFFVRKICVSYPSQHTYFSPKKTVYTGNPLRKEIIQPSVGKAEACSQLKLDAEKPVVLFLGGSLGADTLNKTVLHHLGFWQKKEIQVLLQTGKRFYTSVLKKLKKYEEKEEKADFIHPYPFINNIEWAYAAADIVVSRAGALTLSELCVKKKATILVPSPHVAHDHQTYNAKALHQKGAAMYVSDANATKILPENILQLLKSPKKRLELSEKIGDLAIYDASERVVRVIEKII